ncbi:MAG: glycosyltransferase involved in cell wall biosynthesis [Marinomonas primoryensis]|jgi:glycosyltransferase involved in cell wall biosynthesis
MKILYLHQYFNTLSMSGSSRSYEMASHLVSKGHEVHMITLWRDESSSDGWFTSIENGINVHWLPMQYSNKMGYFQRLQVFLRFAIYAAKKAISLGGDVVFATSTPLTVAIPSVLASKVLRVPMVFEVRDLWPEVPIALGVLKNPIIKALARWLEKFAYKNSAQIIALSPGMKDGVVKVGVQEKKVTVVPNIADIEMFSSQASDSARFMMKHPEIGNRKVVLYAGTFGHINGLSYLVNLAKETKRSGFLDVCFVAIGDGAELPMLMKEAARQGVLDDNFFIYPPIPKAEIPDAMAAADIAISLVIDVEELWVNSANKFFDALASGTPVAINYGGWQADLLKKTGAGVVLSSSDAKSGAIELMGFLMNDKGFPSAKIAAYRLAQDQFTREKLVLRFESVLVEARSSV